MTVTGYHFPLNLWRYLQHNIVPNVRQPMQLLADLRKRIPYIFLVMQTVQLAKVALRAGAGNMVNGLLRAVVKHQVSR